jgi:hypothetical protein
MGSSKRKKARRPAPIRSHGRVTVFQPDGTTVTYSQRVPVAITEEPGSWPEGNGDPLEDIRAACRRSIEKWEGLDVISPELRRKLAGSEARRKLAWWSLFKRWALGELPRR